MDRICPYLALADDGRTVADGFDPEHRCHAVTPPAPLERARQAQLCLTEAHARCDRFAAARTAWLAASSGLPRVAPDVAFGRTRLILEPEPVWRSLTAPPVAIVSRRSLLIAALGGAVVVLLLLGNALGMLGRVRTPTPSPTPSPTAAATPSAIPTASPAAPTSAPAISPGATATPTPAPTQRTYVVQQGDSLSQIAGRFGTTVQALVAANHLTTIDLQIGQVLIIP